MASQTVTVTNVTVIYPAAQQVGIDVNNLPAGTSPDALVKGIQAKLEANLLASWPANYAAYGPNNDMGIMGPWNNNIGGTAPPCLTSQITMDFNAWGLPVDASTITQMAQEITEQIAANGGEYRTFYGKHATGADTLEWGIACVGATVTDGSDELGIVYCFAAVEDLS